MCDILDYQLIEFLLIGLLAGALIMLVLVHD